MKILLSALLFAAASPALSAPLDVVGTWRAESRYGNILGHVRITDCGDGTPCGVLVWFDPTRTRERTDARNPDNALRGRPLIGTTLIEGFERQGQTWRRGRLYNPEDGKTFTSTLQLTPDRNRLRVTGCLGPFCQTKIWTRVAASAPLGKIV
jgi:uncharacterized protein (DUF2147 family)